MPFSRNDIEKSYDSCRRISRCAGSNFPAGFLLLPREKRRAMEALYAFMRHTDDLADDLVPGPARRDALAAWRAALEDVIREKGEGGRRRAEGAAQSMECGVRSGRTSMVNESPLRTPYSILCATPPSPFRLPPSAALPALADAVRRFHIPVEHLYAVIDGVEMDLDRQRYETFDELRQYCERVASAVGLACIHIWGFRGPEAFQPARQAGIALQLTNILRDLKEDAAAGRVYLPLADLRECGYSVEDLLAGVVDQRFRRLMAGEIARAEQFYVDGAELMEWLEPSGRRIFGLMMATYRSLLQKIAHRPADVFRRHVRLGGLKKLQLAARWSLLPPRKDALR